MVGGAAVQNETALLGEDERTLRLLGENTARLAGQFGGISEIAALGVACLLGGGAVLCKGDAVSIWAR